MIDIEWSEQDWRSCAGSSGQVWETSEFQLGNSESESADLEVSTILL